MVYLKGNIRSETKSLPESDLAFFDAKSLSGSDLASYVEPTQNQYQDTRIFLSDNPPPQDNFIIVSLS